MHELQGPAAEVEVVGFVPELGWLDSSLVGEVVARGYISSRLWAEATLWEFPCQYQKRSVAVGVLVPLPAFPNGCLQAR